ncbi:UDP-N-acetylmuramoyl-tripeptide--D-alanyl-D-alanine ligase [compost metagenome]
MKQGGLLVYNGDEPLLDEVLTEESTVKPDGLQTSTFGLSGDNDDYPGGIMFANGKTLFTSHATGNYTLELPLLGEHNVINCLAALTVARHYGVPIESILDGLRNVELTGMRIEMITGTSGITVLNDAYNASPTSMKAAIQVLERMKGYRNKIAVLGDMLELGDSEEEYHREVGTCLSSGKLDYLFTYGKLGKLIAEGAANVLDADHIFAYHDKSELIHKLESVVSPKDIVLIKGSRGMKLEEVVEVLRISSLHI